MPDIERYENVVIGSGAVGKLTAWAMVGAQRVRGAALRY